MSIVLDCHNPSTMDREKHICAGSPFKCRVHVDINKLEMQCYAMCSVMFVAMYVNLLRQHQCIVKVFNKLKIIYPKFSIGAAPCI